MTVRDFPDAAPDAGLRFLRVGRSGPGLSKFLRTGDPPLDAQLLHGERFRPFTPCKVISDIYYMRNRAWLQGMLRAFAHIQEEKKKFFPIF